MAVAQPAFQTRRPSPLSLSSKNPFRNHVSSTGGLAAPSPEFLPPLGPQRDANNLAKTRPVSRNPFLAVFDEDDQTPATQSPPKSSPKGAFFSLGASSPKRVATAGADHSNNLVLGQKLPMNGNVHPKPAVLRTGTTPNPGHRQSRSQEEVEQRARTTTQGLSKPRGTLIEVDLFDRVIKGENRKPRRNSESSVMDKEDDRKRKERRQKEKDARQKDTKPREAKPSRGRKPNAGLDLIDKLDVSGIYGPGLFHHDGPFDACNPHRNRKKDSRAPMQAFPEGSANNVMGGSGPVHKTLNLEQFHGRGAECFNDYNPAVNGNNGAQHHDQYGLAIRTQQLDRQLSFNPKETYTINATDRVEQVHGEVSAGLGTSTFLEGAPAPRSAIQRRESDNQESIGPGGGLMRRKSLAQKIRGLSRQRPGTGEYATVRSPDARYYEQIGPQQSPPRSQFVPRVAQSAGGRGRMMVEKNPFFDEYAVASSPVTTAAAALLRTPPGSSAGRPRGDSNPQRTSLGLMRRMTEGSQGDGVEAKTGGFLSRVKSLRGGKRTRPDRSGS